MLGDLPTDFLRIEFFDSSTHLPHPHPDFIGYLTLTIAEVICLFFFSFLNVCSFFLKARLIKNSGPLGLLRMDPYVRFQMGHLIHETPTASGGGKNPQWKMSYRM